MFDISYALKARKFFPLAPRHQAASQAVRYAKAVSWLGDRWLLATKSEKLSTPRPV
jgi:hypothetical protein